MVAEIWKPIDDYSNYAVSSFGRIRNSLTNHILKPWISSRGYMYVSLSRHSKVKHKSVHRLVAEMFLGKHPTMEVNHINENKTDNRLTNLEWITHKDNLNYGSHNERMKATKRKMKLGKPVLQVSLSGKVIKHWDTESETKNEGFNPRHVNECCRHRRFTHHGYKWIYENEEI